MMGGALGADATGSACAWAKLVAAHTKLVMKHFFVAFLPLWTALCLRSGGVAIGAHGAMVTALANV